MKRILIMSFAGIVHLGCTVESVPDTFVDIATAQPNELKTLKKEEMIEAPTPVPTSTPTPVPTPLVYNNPPTEETIKITDFSFSDPDIEIVVNSTVIWINKDSSSHTATSFNSKFDSGYLSKNQQYTFKFISAGIYRYRCSLHETMRGTITVLSKQGTTSDPTPTPSSSNESENPPPTNYNYY